MYGYKRSKYSNMTRPISDICFQKIQASFHLYRSGGPLRWSWEGGLADVVWEKDHGHCNREIKVKGVVLPGRALAGQKRRQHLKEKEK